MVDVFNVFFIIILTRLAGTANITEDNIVLTVLNTPTTTNRNQSQGKILNRSRTNKFESKLQNLVDVEDTLRSTSKYAPIRALINQVASLRTPGMVN